MWLARASERSSPGPQGRELGNSRLLGYAGPWESRSQGILRPLFSADQAEIRPGSYFGVLGCAGRRETPACPAQLMKLRVIWE